MAISSLGPVQNGNNIPLANQQGNVPLVNEALTNMFYTITFTHVVKHTINYQVVEVDESVTFYGMRQPFGPRQLEMMPIGQRLWRWETIHAYPTLVLIPDEIITIDGVNFRVMQRLDYKSYGFLEYHIVEDYQGG